MFRIAIMAGCLISFSACSQEPAADAVPTNTTSPADTDTAEKLARANPAAEFCITQGGTVEIRKNADGETGYCHLPDGQVIDAWEYFRANHPEEK